MSPAGSLRGPSIRSAASVGSVARLARRRPRTPALHRRDRGACAACLWIALGLCARAVAPAFVSPAQYRGDGDVIAAAGAVPANVLIRAGARGSRLQPAKRAEAVGRAATQEVATAPTDEEIFTVLTTLLQKADKAEQVLEAPSFLEKDGALSFTEFRSLIEKLDVDCSFEEARYAFDEIDTDGKGLLEPIDLRKRLRSSGAVTEMYRSSLMNVLYTVVPALLLAVFFAFTKDQSSGLDFVTGYVVEDSLSVDNLFVFITLFKFFRVPPRLQKFCLNVGIIGAVVLRATFIFGGLALVKLFQPLLLVFSGFLLYTSYQGLFGEDDDDEDEGPPEAVQSILNLLPATSKYEGERLLVQEEKSGQWLATPLLICIIAVELCDILFAVDSVPAIFAITSDPVIVYTSNIAAILGLRSLFQVLAIAVQDFAYLEKSVALVLGFVGLKLGSEVFGADINSFLSLVVILGILGGGIALSLAEEAQNRAAEEKQAA